MARGFFFFFSNAECYSLLGEVNKLGQLNTNSLYYTRFFKKVSIIYQALQ
jgi:hypothetical protein